LHTPKLYEKDPINNWSQIIYDDLVGKSMVLSGHIRTERVSEAALWIQCFSKRGSRVLSAVSSIGEFPLSGTNGWTLVSASVVPPKGTNFVVIRCVMTGAGKAWFDTMSLSVDSSDDGEGLLDALELIEVEEDVPIVVVEESTSPTPSSLNPEDIMAMSKLMQDTIRQLELDNRELLSRISDIQGDLNEYRAELNERSADSGVEVPLYGMHPLVPHGYIVELDN
jgi:hypothetical protein